jgi:uncharacterized protein
VDLMVIMPCRGRTQEREFHIRQSLRVPFPLDVLVRTPAEISRRVAQNDFFLREVLEKGTVLYDAPHSRMGPQSRSRLPKRPA